MNPNFEPSVLNSESLLIMSFKSIPTNRDIIPIKIICKDIIINVK